MTEDIKVALIDDDPAVLDSLKQLLAAHHFEVRPFTSGKAFLDSGSLERVNCVVSDVRMPEMTGTELHKTIRGLRPSMPVIFITGHGDVAMAVAALKAGAADFVEKPFTAEQIIASIRSSVEDALRRKKDDEAAELFASRISELSPRQRQVLDLVIDGLSSKEIANKLGLSVRTVENYRAWVMERTGASNLASLIRMTLSAKMKS